jgi:hypothetical protein
MVRVINWARYDRLKAQGHSERDIAGALGIPRTTLRRALEKRQGLPRRSESGGPPAPVQKPAQNTDTGAEYRADTDAEQHIDTGAVSSVDIGAVHGLDTAAVQRLDRLEDQVVALTTLVKSLAERMSATPGPTPVQISALPPYPKGKAVRWNLWILEAIREEVASLAAERDLSPSQLVQELLWKALSDRSASPP